MSQSHGKVLIVDDEIAIRRALHNTLHGMGFEVDDASSGEAALDRVGEAEYDVVLMDINMPGIGGIRACREIRKSLPRLGILMLTVRDREEDKVTALDAGADDYITKPFNIRELAARIRAAVRRSSASHVDPDAVIRIGNIELDPARRLVRKGGEPVHFTPTEFDLLRYLMAHAGLPITHARCCCTRCGDRSTEASWNICGLSFASYARSSKTTRLNPTYLLTDSHIGYRFAEGAADAVLFGIFRDVVALVQHRHQLVDDDARVLIVGRVVFGGTVGGAVAPFLRVRFGLLRSPARVDEHAEHDRNFAAIDQVVEHVLRTDVAVGVLESLPILEDHQAGRDRWVVLPRNVHPIGMLGAGVDFTGQRERPLDFPFGNPLLRHRIRAQAVLRIGIGGRLCRVLSDRHRGPQHRHRHRTNSSASHRAPHSFGGIAAASGGRNRCLCTGFALASST
jgi:two-component system KDP operon response regulator KdpE